ncbi:uncharacterized protein LOC9642630 [Selaginella moellendorffii]|uniref:uncharacterized protein LOC9642630 n=1 Tax=Selaginella moellendorffii TaxID=88036 RepID=UPI000D1C77DB|nr:uncharacterized protein LOC9642630 [Selaginella moellendorffii]|eukprot:XP_024534261.1 uncharacterized protein LOC9642630 [Selaginella moellendorffii]
MAALSGLALASPIAAPHQGFLSCARPGSAALLHRRAECLALSRRAIPAVNAAISMSARVNAGAEVSVQDFLEEARELGKVHLYINTHTGQWKTRTPMEMFRYSDAEEDAWDACLVHDDGKQEMTMYVRRVATASFKQDKVLGVPYYIIQFISLRAQGLQHAAQEIWTRCQVFQQAPSKLRSHQPESFVFSRLEPAGREVFLTGVEVALGSSGDAT